MEYDIEEFQENIEEVKKLLIHARKLEELVKELDGPLTDGPLGAGVLVYDMC